MKTTIVFVLLLGLQVQAQDVKKYEKRVGEIIATRTAKGPVINGSDSDPAWKEAKKYTIGVDIPKKVLEPEETMTLKVVHDGEYIYFLMKWKDKSKSTLHKPFRWNRDRRAYVAGEELEDTGFIAFEKTGPFNINMRAGVDASWDLWYWGAARTNSVGYAVDKTHHYSRKKPKEYKSRFTKLDDGKFGYIARLKDKGRPVRKKISPPDRRRGRLVHQYKAQIPTESAADVRAKGVWRRGWWTLEFKRKLNTGHTDDTAFDLGKGYGFSIGFARESEHEDHLTSMPYTLRFKE